MEVGGLIGHASLAADSPQADLAALGIFGIQALMMIRVRKISPIMWLWWLGLSTTLLLNVNAIAALLGAPMRLFSPLILVLACGVVIGFGSELKRIRFAPVPAVLVFFLIYLLVGLFSATTAHYTTTSAALTKVPLHFASVLIIVAGALVAIRATAAGQLDTFLKLLFVMVTAAALSGVIFLTVPAIATLFNVLPGDRMHGVFTNVNELGQVSGYPIIIGLGLTMRTRNPLWVIIGVTAGFTGAISSFSKTAILALVPLLGLVAYAMGGAAIKLKPMLLLAVALVAVVFVGRRITDHFLGGDAGPLATFEVNRIAAISGILETGSFDASATTGRTEIWHAGLIDWMKSPIIGLGLSAFDSVKAFDMEIHNTFLRVLGESGIIGMVALLAMVFSFMTTVFRCRQKDIHIIGLGFLIIQLAIMMSAGGILLLRNQNLLTGCVMGLLVGSAWLSERERRVARALASAAAPGPVEKGVS
jgi:O-antigen ligase